MRWALVLSLVALALAGFSCSTRTGPYGIATNPVGGDRGGARTARTTVTAASSLPGLPARTCRTSTHPDGTFQTDCTTTFRIP